MARMLGMLMAVCLLLSSPVISSAGEMEQGTSSPNGAAQKEQFEKSMEERLKDLGKQLDELKASAAEKTGKAQKEVKSYLAEAEKKQKAALRELEALRRKSGKKWDTFVAKMNAAANDFDEAFEKAKSRFKE